MKKIYRSFIKRPHLTTFIKFVVSAVFIYWFIKTEKFNLQIINLGITNYKLGLIFFVLTFIQLVLAAIRTQVLTNACSNDNLGLRKSIELSWAASLVTSIAPSSLFGDLFRIKSLTDYTPNLTLDDRVYISILPKFLSLLGLFIVSAASGVMIINHAENLKLLLGTLYLFLFAILLLFIFKGKIITLIAKETNFHFNPFFHNRLSRLKNFLLNYLQNPKCFYQSFITSLFIQILNTLSFLMIINFVHPEHNVSLLYLACLVPIGILVMTLPIAISGLGVGHMAFSKLLYIAGIPNGADIFTIFLAFSFLFNLVGIIPFILLQKDQRKKATADVH